MGLFQPKRYTKQPQQPAKVDRSILPAIARVYVGRRSILVGSVFSLPELANSGGVGYSNTGTGASGVSIGASKLVTSNGVGTGDFTIVLNTAAASTSSASIAYGNLVNSPQVYLALNSDIGLSPVAGSVSFINNSTGLTLASVLNGKPRTIIFSRIGTTLSGYVDGALIASATFTENVSNVTEYLGGYSSAGFGISGYAINLLAISNAGLRETKARQLSANPWQLFIDQARLPWVGVAASAGGDVTVALTGQAVTASTGTLTSSSSIALTGSAATASAGTLQAASAIALTGQSATSAAGTITQSRSIALTGSAATVSQGALSVAGDKTVALTGQAMTMAQGTLAASSGTLPVEAAATIMRVTTTNKQVPQLISTIALNGGTMRASSNLSTIMRAMPINRAGLISSAAINRTASLL